MEMMQGIPIFENLGMQNTRNCYSRKYFMIQNDMVGISCS